MSNVLEDENSGDGEEWTDCEEVHEEVSTMGGMATDTNDSAEEENVMEDMDEENRDHANEKNNMGDIEEETKNYSMTTTVSDKGTTRVGPIGNIQTKGKNRQQCPIWSTYNSLITKETPIWNVGICAPLYRRSPTDWPVLLTILMQAQQINCMAVGDGCRPVITLDGDLYHRAVRLKDYKSQWCIRLGCLHIVIAALKCLGKYVEGSGIDIAWQESGLYGPATVRQILDGRHVYRAIEAHTVTLIALHHLFFQSVFTENEQAEITQGIKKIVQSFKMYVSDPSKGSKISEEQINLMHHQLSTRDTFNVWKKGKKVGKESQNS